MIEGNITQEILQLILMVIGVICIVRGIRGFVMYITNPILAGLFFGLISCGVFATYVSVKLLGGFK